MLGAGFQGACVALELAARGVAVDLFDRNDTCITQAGARNEGKIHLGFVYANDASFDTARLLVEGALGFDRAVCRWLECDIEDVGLSTPHTYAVHRASMLPTDAVLAHFARVRALVREIGCSGRHTYLGEDPRTVGYEPQLLPDAYDPEAIVGVIRTGERSVNVVRLAGMLRRRIAADPRIAFHPQTVVTGAGREAGSISICLAHGGTTEARRYHQVVNCLWDGKLAIDQQMEFLPPYTSLYRLKFGILVRLRQASTTVPSVTFVVGPFGDIVQLDPHHLYFSWYPIARRAISMDTDLLKAPRELHGPEADRTIHDTLNAFGQLVPAVRALTPEKFEEATVAGGIILAAGKTDIDDPDSRLHARCEVGIRSADGYHSIDTGKYTLAPMFAVRVADRICGTR